MNEEFDVEFKRYINSKGVNIDPNLFDLQFNPPQNFAAYRQAEMDTARVNVFGSIVAVPFISKRFAMKRFLGMTAEEVAENEKMWKEENIDRGTNLSAQAELRSAGITAGGLSSDADALAGSAAPPEDMDLGDLDAAPAPTSGGSAPTV
jgi:hypothetical protein